MSAKLNDHDPITETDLDSFPMKPEAARDDMNVSAASPDSTVISSKLFRSPKGNVYRITKTNETDDYSTPKKAPPG